jgi:hypothetical protein
MTKLYGLFFLFCFSAMASEGTISQVLSANTGKTIGTWTGNTSDKGKPCELKIDTFSTNDFWVSLENFYYKNETGVGPFLDNTSEFTLRQITISRSNQALMIDIRQSIGWPFSIKEGRLYKLVYDRSFKIIRYELTEGSQKAAVCLFKY